jgi:hypothetical protein
MIVRPDSSDPGITESRPIPIDANHIEISKPKDRSSDVYVHVRSFVERQVNHSTIQPPQINNLPRGEERIIHRSDSENNNMNNITINIFDNRDPEIVEKIIRALTKSGDHKVADLSVEQKR